MRNNLIHKAIKYVYLHGWRYRTVATDHRRRIEAIHRRGDQVRVVFYAMSVAMWRYEHLLELMLSDTRYRPTVVISPSVDYTPEQRRRDVEGLHAYFSARNISYVDCDLDGAPFDVKGEIDPDVLFYPQPYEHLLVPEHDCLAFYDRLVCYYPYAFWTSTGKWSYNFHFHNLAWRLYYSTKMHLAEAQKTATNKGRNVRVVGYPNADDFLSGNYADVWKHPSDGKTRKRLIWAPHYAISPEFGLIARSNFLSMAQPMLELAQTLSGQLQVAFKPHPRLLTELYNHPDWGKRRTDDYYAAWANGENTQLETGGFVDLFMTSDGMVHDSGSFAVEYHYTLNPVMFVSSDMEPLLKTQSDFGKLAYKLHEVGAGMADVERFVKETVLGGKDRMRSWREWFYTEYLLPPNGKTVAQNTLNDLNLSIFGDDGQ